MSETNIKGISSQKAWEILESDPQAVLLDVRTNMEYEYVGHPLNALNIPWMNAPDWKVDTGFVDKVRQTLQKKSGASDESLESVAILAICRSGKRSLAAAAELARWGFSNLYNIEDGFEGDLDNKRRSTVNGWKFSGLPWEQS